MNYEKCIRIAGLRPYIDQRKSAGAFSFPADGRRLVMQIPQNYKINVNQLEHLPLKISEIPFERGLQGKVRTLSHQLRIFLSEGAPQKEKRFFTITAILEGALLYANQQIVQP